MLNFNIAMKLPAVILKKDMLYTGLYHAVQLK